MKLTSVEIQAILEHSLRYLYPQPTLFNYTYELLYTKTFRWSYHFVFRVSADHRSDSKVLVKIIRKRDKKGRVQDEGNRHFQRAKLEYDALASIYMKVSNEALEGVTAVRPLAFWSDYNALVCEYLPGRHLLSILNAAGAIWGSRRERHLAEQTAYNGGRLLGIIHKIQKVPYPQIRSLDTHMYVKGLETKIRELLKLECPKAVREEIARTRNSLEQLLNYSHAETIFSHLHGDYYPENIVCSQDGRVFTIDTTLHQIGPIEQDIAKFMAGVKLTKRSLLFGSIGMRTSVQERVIHAFLNGYRNVGNFNRRVLFAFLLLALLQRWIEILEVVRGRVPSPAGTVLRSVFTPSIEGELRALRTTIELEVKND